MANGVLSSLITEMIDNQVMKRLQTIFKREKRDSFHSKISKQYSGCSAAYSCVIL